MLFLRAMYQSPLARQPWRVNTRLEGLRGLGVASARLVGGGSLRRQASRATGPPGAAFSRQPRDWYIALTISESG